MSEFLELARILNKELQLVPVLYGSLGLQMVTGMDLEPQDMDVLVPLEYLQEKWDVLRQIVEQMGYTFVNLREHEFHKEGMKLAFAFMEDLADYADVDYNSLKFMEQDGAQYRSLSLEDYLRVYTRSLKDGYRRTKNNSKDEKKIEIIRRLLPITPE